MRPTSYDCATCSYGFPAWSYSTTAKQGPAVMMPWACNDVITCGGVSVRVESRFGVGDIANLCSRVMLVVVALFFRFKCDTIMKPKLRRKR